MVISHNIAAMNTYGAMTIANKSTNRSMEKLSSGYRINRSGDDAAGLSISEKMRSQIRGLKQASTNAANGVSMIQTAEGALNEQHAILQRMRELAVQSATDTNAGEDRDALQSELEQLTCEINRISKATEFNGMKILNGDKEIKENGGTPAVYTVVTDGTLTISELRDNYPDYQVMPGTGDNTYEFTANNSPKTDAELASANAASNVAGVAKTLLEGDAAITTVTVKTNSTKITGTTDNSVYFHVGANRDQVINTEFRNMSAHSLGLTSSRTTDISAETLEATVVDDKTSYAYYSFNKNVNNGVDTVATEYGLDISTRNGANSAITVIDKAIAYVSEERSKFGATQNRIEYTINNVNTTSENLQSAESRIRDVDMAGEIMEMTKNNILQQASQSMLTQAMQRPQQALQLLQGS